MIKINLSQIPTWLSKSIFLKDNYERLSYLEYGTEEYTEEFLDSFDVPYFSRTDKINNRKDFENIIETSKYFQIKFPPSIYLYIYENFEKVLKRLKNNYKKTFVGKEKEKINSSQGELLNFIESIENGLYFINNRDDIIWYAQNELNYTYEKINEMKDFYPVPKVLPKLNYKFILSDYTVSEDLADIDDIDEIFLIISNLGAEISILMNGLPIGNFTIDYTIYLEKLIKALKEYNENGKNNFEFINEFGPNVEFTKENYLFIYYGGHYDTSIKYCLNLKDSSLKNIIINLEELLNEIENIFKDLKIDYKEIIKLIH